MEDSVAEEAETSNHEIDSGNKKKKGSIHIVKLEFTEADEEDTKETKRKNPQDTNPIPG